MKTDLLEEQSSGIIDGYKAYAYTFLKLLETLMVLAEIFDYVCQNNVNDEMLFAVPLQGHANKGLVIVNSTTQTTNEAVDGVELFV